MNLCCFTAAWLLCNRDAEALFFSPLITLNTESNLWGLYCFCPNKQRQLYSSLKLFFITVFQWKQSNTNRKEWDVNISQLKSSLSYYFKNRNLLKNVKVCEPSRPLHQLGGVASFPLWQMTLMQKQFQVLILFASNPNTFLALLLEDN